MARERVKDLVLTALVITSVLLTGRLWFDPSRAYWEAEAGIEVYSHPATGREGRPLTDPVRLVVHFGRDRHSVFYPNSAQYQQLWRGVREAVAGADWTAAAGQTRVSREELDRARREYPGVELLLADLLPLDTWLELWGRKPSPGTSPGPALPTNRLFLALGNAPVIYLSVDRGDYYLRIASPGGAELAEMIGRIWSNHPEPYVELLPRGRAVALDQGIYVPARPPSLPSLVPTGQSGIREELVGSFFVDTSIVRRIREHDGAMIYTDGQRGLRMTLTGGIEYTAPLPPGGEGPSVVAAMEEAAEFVARRGGWPADLALAKARGPARGEDGVDGEKQRGERERVELSYARLWDGIAILGPHPALEMTVTGKGISRFSYWGVERLLPVSPRPLPPVERILDVLAQETGGREAMRVISDVYPAFYTRGPGDGYLARPAWIVEYRDGGIRAFEGR